jgi:hypothetical protein
MLIGKAFHWIGKKLCTGTGRDRRDLPLTAKSSSPSCTIDQLSRNVGVQMTRVAIPVDMDPSEPGVFLSSPPHLKS